MKKIVSFAVVLFIVFSCNTATQKQPPSIKSLVPTFERYTKEKIYSVLDTLTENYKKEFAHDSIFVSRLDSLWSIADSTRQAEVKQKEEDKKLAIEAADKAKRKLRTFRVQKDEFKSTSFYQHKSSPSYVNRNGFYCYFGMDDKGNVSSLRLKVQYYADDWLFIRRCEILIDGEKFDYAPGSFDRDNEGGKIWEFNDTQVNDSTLSMLESVAEGKVVKIRFVGDKYYNDKTISSTQKKALKEVLEVHRALSNPLL